MGKDLHLPAGTCVPEFDSVLLCIHERHTLTREFEALETRDLLTKLAVDTIEPVGVLTGDNLAAELQSAVAPVETANKSAAGHKIANSVILPAGSTDGLATAISEAGPGGTVIVESGLHEESGGVTVDIPVSIIGEPGAIMRVSTEPVGPSGDAALLIQGADHALVEGISFEATSGAGNVAIRIVDSQQVTVRNNVITGHLFGVIVGSGDHIEVSGNKITGLPDPDIGYCCIGIVNNNGAHTRIIGNEISEFDLGIFASGVKGHMQFNSVHDNNIGVLLCQTSVADSPATRWHVANNNAYDNVLWGYLVTDFAIDNFLVNNAASNNGLEDILLDGGEFPPAIETLVALGSHKLLTVTDDGIDNKVNGG